MHNLVTIITPTFNRYNFLPTCIESVINQTYSNIEYIIIDDCSDDNTEELVYSYKDSRIKYIKLKRNVGNLKASSKAMDLAKGYYCGFVDSDDYIEKDCVEKCVLNIGNAGMIYTNSSFFGDKQGIVPMCRYPYSKKNILKVFMTFHFRLFKTGLWHKIKPLTDVWHAWDYDFSLRMSEIAEIKHLPISLYNWRIHGNNLHKDSINLKNDLDFIRKQALIRRGLL